MPGLFLSVSVFLRVFPVLWWLYHALYISLLLQDSSIADMTPPEMKKRKIGFRREEEK